MEIITGVERRRRWHAEDKMRVYLAARDPARQVAEVQIRCAILNTIHRLGTPDTIATT